MDSTIHRAHQRAAGARQRPISRPSHPGTNHPDHGLGAFPRRLNDEDPSRMSAGPGPVTLPITAGQRGVCPQFIQVLDRVRVPRPGPGRPRKRPDRVLADKAYLSRANRSSASVEDPDSIGQARVPLHLLEHPQARRSPRPLSSSTGWPIVVGAGGLYGLMRRHAGCGRSARSERERRADWREVPRDAREVGGPSTRRSARSPHRRFPRCHCSTLTDPQRVAIGEGLRRVDARLPLHGGGPGRG